MKKTLLFLLLLLYLAQLSAQNFPNGFSFYLPEFDSSAQRFLPEFPAFTISEADRVTAQGDAFFAYGAPIRFWGVNIVSAGAFPAKNQAPAIAARMRKMGINLVRFHHLDNPWSGNDGSIFINSQGTRQLNPATLDRLDFFIAQLKRNGIYVNMNLNVSRTFRESDGVPGADSIPDFGKAVTLFDPWMQFLQREYAQQLLGHVNPYTGRSLAQDPVLAMVETNNENSLYGYWKDNGLRAFAQGGILMQRHVVLLDSMWNAFLQTKYGTQQALANAWNIGLVPAGTGEVLQNRGFENGAAMAPWSLELHETAVATISASSSNPHSGTYCGLLKVDNVTGTDWHIQFKSSGFTLQKDTNYVLHFWARANAEVQFSVTVMRDNAPYNWYTGQTFSATTTWKEFSLSFKAPEDNLGFGRVSISTLNHTGQFCFDDFSLAKPEVKGLLSGENLAAGTVKRILWAEKLQYSDQRVADMAAFYIQLQKKHLDELYAYLKNNLDVPTSITGSNALVGPPDAAEHEDMDYLDDHSYWDHPQFPHTAWDSYDWLINNQPMLKNPDYPAIANIFAGLNYSNKPYTISEYNHPAPNRFRVEMPAAMAAYAAFHGADGLMFFDYNSSNTWGPDVMNSYFSLIRDNSIMALFPSCARAYRAGLIAPDPNPIVLQYTADDIYHSPKTDFNYRWQQYTPYPRLLALSHAVKTASYRAATSTDLSTLPNPEAGVFTTATDETILNTDNGLLTTATPRFCAITGFLQDAPQTSAGNLRLIQSSDFGSITWVSTGPDALDHAPRSLLTISSKQQNTNMIWDGTQTVHDNWGTAPTLQNPLTLQLELSILADYIRVYPLDAKGKESAYQTVMPSSPGHFTFTVNQSQSKTLWFGIEAFGGQITGTEEAQLLHGLSLSPNPVSSSGQVQIAWNMEQSGQVQGLLYNSEGRLVRTVLNETLPAGPQSRTFGVEDLPAGTYQLRLEGRGANGVQAGVTVSLVKL